MEPIVYLSEKAAEEVRRMASAEGGLKDPVLRLKVTTGGCSGFSYGMAIEDGSRPDDTVVEAHGVRVAIDPFSQPYLRGLKLDFKDGFVDGGFSITNPNAKSTCGCGSSFSA